MSSLTENHLLSIFGFGKDNIYVGGAEGTMLHFDGTKWNSMDLNGRWAINNIWGASPNNVFAVGSRYPWRLASVSTVNTPFEFKICRQPRSTPLCT